MQYSFVMVHLSTQESSIDDVDDQILELSDGVDL